MKTYQIEMPDGWEPIWCSSCVEEYKNGGPLRCDGPCPLSHAVDVKPTANSDLVELEEVLMILRHTMCEHPCKAEMILSANSLPRYRPVKEVKEQGEAGLAKALRDLCVVYGERANTEKDAYKAQVWFGMAKGMAKALDIMLGYPIPTPDPVASGLVDIDILGAIIGVIDGIYDHKISIGNAKMKVREILSRYDKEDNNG